ncbi:MULTISPECIES: hypothetical protein [Ralstonia]|jgi:hypothetical protein|uniref:hypothetical protein n=1 Tax=Ralstonia TaxID=48736 RepID=UPI00022BF65F|nr:MULTISPECIES: hypothetical protein [Ralstonia]MBY4706870.1 hypothetical protein [Ralstonia insidiosa]GAQ27939.1 hypothetical protein SAMD00023378_1622 [Ralstonia sp. NT80]EGY66264.1 hypothetical protein HMPREF0989_01194 [Ralstonia sp. 5_2_56FAA]NPT51758.1 hypothetical protein [Ralstonia sp. 3N]SCW84170.1 hypothetical protein SAMN02799637_02834 [Ralstonia sp. UNCCL144]
MSDFLNYTAGLHALDKIGEQGRAIERQSGEIQRQQQALQGAKHAVGLAEAGEEYERKRANEYKALLSKPFAEIAAKDGRFKENYEKQQELLAAWIVSQRAFKEVAMKYGQAMGKSSEEVLSEFQAAKETVLNDQSNFGNTVDETEKKAYKRYLDKEQG